MAFGDDDLTYMYADVLGVDVMFGAQTARGFLDIGDRLEPDGQGAFYEVRGTSLEINTGTLTGRDIGDAITADGTDYVVRLIENVGTDGKRQRITLAEA
jgi:hypothetical protein